MLKLEIVWRMSCGKGVRFFVLLVVGDGGAYLGGVFFEDHFGGLGGML
jgi:hypothetical protein